MTSTNLSGLIEQLRVAKEGSRELDGEIARHFGWFQRTDEDDPVYTNRISTWWHDPDAPETQHHSPPSWSTDLSAIVALVEKRLPSGVDITLRMQTGGKYNHVEFDTGDEDEKIAAYNCPSLPLALCIAILLALQSEVPNV